ncbi:hypothetical protein HY498_03965 [Candidatus Woesearchaeota archaeon]|nr:hypothetical protein [Candidatus Woesearchaeota archaeon]
MNIMICCSKYFYEKIPEIKKALEKNGHSVNLPNSYDNPLMEEKMKQLSKDESILWKANMLRKDHENIIKNDAILVLNLEKKGQRNYIGGATFLEIAKAFELGKKIFLFNSIPENIFKDELVGINPIIINGNLSKIR